MTVFFTCQDFIGRNENVDNCRYVCRLFSCQETSYKWKQLFSLEVLNTATLLLIHRFSIIDLDLTRSIPGPSGCIVHVRAGSVSTFLLQQSMVASSNTLDRTNQIMSNWGPGNACDS